MSADDAYFVQQNKNGNYTAQWGSMSADELPDPEKAEPNHVFETIDTLVVAMAKEAYGTEYGFRFHIPSMTVEDHDDVS